MKLTKEKKSLGLNNIGASEDSDENKAGYTATEVACGWTDFRPERADFKPERAWGSVAWSVTHSLDDPHSAPYWPTLPCYFTYRPTDRPTDKASYRGALADFRPERADLKPDRLVSYKCYFAVFRLTAPA